MTRTQADDLKRHLQSQIDADIETERMRFRRIHAEEERGQLLRLALRAAWVRLTYCLTSPVWWAIFTFCGVLTGTVCLLFTGGCTVGLITYTVLMLWSTAFNPQYAHLLMSFEGEQ